MRRCNSCESLSGYGLGSGGFSSEQKSRIPHYLRTGYFLDQGSPSLIAIISVKGLAKAIGQNVTL